ncbi:Mur ligase domain-containing protein, partial [Escherichia coli]|nr:Mur ligase domain-containing protein [Escherichia coli]
MKLKELNGIPALAISEFGETTINGLTSDSREVKPGFLFAALKGSKADGSVYAADAAKRG